MKSQHPCSCAVKYDTYGGRQDRSTPFQIQAWVFVSTIFVATVLVHEFHVYIERPFPTVLMSFISRLLLNITAMDLQYSDELFESEVEMRGLPSP